MRLTVVLIYLVTGIVRVSPEKIEGDARNYTGETVSRAKRQVKQLGPGREVQAHAQWNLAMLSMGEKQDFPKSQFGYRYEYFADPGKGVDLYIIDQDFTLKDQDLAGRVRYFERYGRASRPGPGAHGDCSASLAGGAKFGVAKQANLLAVTARSSLAIIRAVRDIVKQHKRKVANREDDPGWAGSVICVLVSRDGLVGDFKISLVRASKVAEAAGILIVWSAGNDKEDLTGGNDNTPLRPPFQYGCMLPGGLCVGNVNKNYVKDVGSNFGPPLSLWAPSGHEINCAGYANMLVGGTSFSAPLVAGVAAVMLGYDWAHEKKFKDNTFFLKLAVMGNAKPGLLTGIGNSRNLLANTGIHSSQQSSKPFRDVDVLEVVRAELGLTAINLAETGHVDALNFECLPLEATARISWLQAQQLWLSLRWEIGRLNEYENELYQHKYHPPIPCIGNACVFIRPNENAAPDRLLAAFDVSVWEKCILYLINICSGSQMANAGSSRVDNIGPLHDTTGGWMELPDVPGWFIHLRSKSGVELALPTLSPRDTGEGD